MPSLRKRFFVLRGHRFVRLGMLVWLGLAGVSWAQPINDNFAQAQDLGNVAAGTTTGFNAQATREPGEPLITGNPGGASVWYMWTAPANMIVTFDTFGSDFNTLLGVYTGDSVTNLTLVNQNDDYGATAQSSVTFAATAGTVYHIAVDGYFYPPVDIGNITLNWGSAGGALAGGDFRFTTSLYIVSQSESMDPRGAGMTNAPARMTVTRVNGARGRMLVNYIVTNVFYTNWTFNELCVENIGITNAMDMSFTNIAVTNFFQDEHIQDNVYGQWTYDSIPDIRTLFTLSNFNGNVSITFTNLGTNDPGIVCMNKNFMSMDTNGIAVTNFFSTNWLTTNFPPTAVPGVDYYPPQQATVIFDDFQMSADIFVNMPKRPPNSLPFPLHAPPLVNRVVVGNISSVTYDPLETTNLAPPTATSTYTNTLMNILDQTVLPGTGQTGTNVFEFERATLRCSEDIGTARVAVYRVSDNYSQGTSVPYRIDYDFGNNRTVNWDVFRFAPTGVKPGEGPASEFDSDVQLQAGSDYAVPLDSPPDGGTNVAPRALSTYDFIATNGVLNWGANDGNPKFIDIPVTNDDLVEFNEDLIVQLYFPPPPPTDKFLGWLNTCVVTILFDDQPAGAVDRDHNQDNVGTTSPPFNQHPGANSTVFGVVVQPDGKTVVGGDFTAFNTQPINRLARMNVDGQRDVTFDPGDGADGFVTALALDSSSRILAVGGFTSINRTARQGVARLNSDGSLDGSFLPGLGANATVWAVASQSDGKTLIAGEFTTFNSTNRNFLARLNGDGSLDTTFDPGVGPDGPVLALALQGDGRVLIGGEFGSVDGVLHGHIARLNTNGTLDGSFDAVGAGADDIVYALALQTDGKVVAGGVFRSVQGLARNSVARFNVDGTVDLTFDPGKGANDTVYAVKVQPDGGILIGGIFTIVNETRRVGIARLYPDGPVDTTFMDTAYNQFAGVPTHYYNPNVEGPNFVFTMDLQTDGNVLIGGGFSRVGGGYARDDVRQRANVARLIGGATPGPGNIALRDVMYNADQRNTNSTIALVRTNGTLGAVSVTVSANQLPPGPGAAISGVDYTFDAGTFGHPSWNSTWNNLLGTWMLSDADTGENLKTKVKILNSTNSGNKALNMNLTEPNGNDLLFLGGQNIPLGVALGRSISPLTIVDNHTLAGVMGFSSPTYRVSENTNAVITVTRTNGSAGLVTINFATSNGTATNGIHYRANSGRLTFNPGVTNQTFTVTNINESIVDHDHTVNLTLSAPTGGATNGLINAVLTITDDDVVGGYAEFSSPTYFTNENAGFALITVTRNGSSAGQLAVQFTTTNGSAISGVNYTGVTNTLTWPNNDSAAKTIAIPLIDDGLVNASNLTVNLRLFASTVNGVTNLQALGNVINAVLTITNSDFRGQVAWSTNTYAANENGGPATVTVIRAGGSSESVSVNFATSGGTALPGPVGPPADYIPTNGVLNFGPGEVSKSFDVFIFDHPVDYVDPPNRSIGLVLSLASPTNALGIPSTAIINIIDDETVNQPPGGIDTSSDPALGFNNAVHALALQADGNLLVGGDFTTANGQVRNRIARLDGQYLTLDTHFSSINPAAGANGTVLAIVSQTDYRILVGGNFTNFNSVARNYLARLTFDGSVDTTFNPGQGPDSPVYALAETFVGSGRKLLVGGAFTTITANSRNGIARLNDDGSVDQSFDVGIGANGPVWALAVQTDGKALIGGDFTAVNGQGRNHIARLNTDGSVDLSFNPGGGAGDSVRAIALQSDGRIVIGGLFTNVNGVALNHAARLTTSGAVDGTFIPGLGADDAVLTINVQGDTRIVLGGQFSVYNGVTRHGLTRLNNDGTTDTRINFGGGADNFVAASLVQPDGKIVFGGGFTHYDGQPSARIARIYGGTIAGPGAFEFTSALYQANENTTNALITVRRRGGTSGAPTGNVSVHLATSDGTATAGSNYTAVATNLVFPPGETLANVSITVTQDFVITPDLTVNLALTDPEPQPAQPPGGPIIGNQPTAILDIVNVDSGIGFSSATYIRNEDASDGVATIPILRFGSTQGVASVTFFTTTNGTALAGTNYVPVSNLVSFAVGQGSNFVQVPVIHDPTAQGNRTVIMELTNAQNSLLFVPFEATLTINDVERLPGQFLFSQTNYVISEAAGSLPVTVVRSNGNSGAVSVNFTTVPGTALPGTKYISTNGALSFAGGETSKTFTVTIVNNSTVEGNQTFSLLLTNAQGGATIAGPTNELVTILDDDVGVTFASPVYVVPETAGNVSLTVIRQNATGDVVRVSYATTNIYNVTTNGGNVVTNISAGPGTNYVAVTNSLTFTNGETIKSLNIGVLHDPRVTGDLSFGVNLFNPVDLTQPSAPVQVFNIGEAIVTVLDSESGFFFTNANFYTTKSSTNVLITVLRTNANTGTVFVNYATSNDTAVAGVDYVATSGLLTYSNGIPTQSFTVPIINNSLVEGDRTFTVNLLNPTPANIASLLAPSTATVTITDVLSGLSFSSPVYTINENGGSAAITVLRSSFTNSTVSVDFSAANGPPPNGATNLVNFIATNGTFIFTNGETLKTFSVPVIDNGIPDGDKLVLLSLNNLLGAGVLISPSSATLTIGDIDGTSVIPSGTALIGESGPVNGVIDPGELVTVLFGLRAAGGTNPVNLTATLLAGNGVANPSGQQTYGPLVVHGPSASRPFTFTANGTNGQTITATLQLHDGSKVLSNALFNFTLGSAGLTFSNTALIRINDNTNATPYPSIINVSGLGGQVSKVTATLTNLNHTGPSDIDTLLVSPSGRKTFLMAKCGGNNALSRVTLTFDDAAATSLPLGQIVSGTNRPTSYAVAPPPFPIPAPPPPYNTNLSLFNGSNPNGAWLLYVFDDTSFDSGTISNGWSLTFNTLPPTSADVGLAMSASSSNVVATSNLTFIVTLSNYGPAGATNIVVTDTLPGGAVYVSSTPSTGATTTNGAGFLTWNVTSLAANASATLSILVRPGVPGLVTNSATVTTLATSDPNADDNSASAVVNVVSATADLVLNMIGAPNPALLGATVTYTITVSNGGPATATALALTNTLPPAVNFLYATPSNTYAVAGNIVAFSNLGNLGANGRTNATIVLKPLVAGTITNTAAVVSGVTDPLKANNTASAKVVVEGMTISSLGGSIVVAWPADVGNYTLESATNLSPPAAWTVFTNAPTILVGGQNTVTVPVGSGQRFFRLHSAP